ncbi:MAG: T9SS type A sorting domain-containing protein [Flavobacteriales bacterium]
MKRTYTALLLLGAISAQAQSTQPRIPLDPGARDGYRTPAELREAGHAKGNSYYSETFDSGLNGWTVETSLGAVDWKWTDVGPGLTSSTYPVPALNTSTPSGWAIIDDDFDGVSGQSTDASLVSPVIDLSSAPPNMKLEFDQYFQEFQADACFVGISTDGGANWDEIEVNAGVGRDGRPNPELMDVNISPWVAADPTNVMIRFRYTATWDYGWQVDNVRVVDLEDNDMAIVQAHYTDYTYDDVGATSGIEYSMIPSDHVAPMVMNAALRNRGFLQQTGVTLTVDVAGPNGSSFNDSSAPATYEPLQNDTAMVTAYTPGGGVGTYNVTFTVSQDQVDDLPGDNVATASFQVSSGIYATDDGVADGYFLTTGDNDGVAVEIGNTFNMVVADEAYGIQVALHENTSIGSIIYAAIYEEHIVAATEHPTVLEYTVDHIVTEADLNAIGGSTFITIPFSSPVTLNAGQSYSALVGTAGGADDMAICTSGESAALSSNVHYPSGIPGSANVMFYTTSTPMVRLQLSGAVGIAERMMDNGVGLGQNMPNPTTGVTTIPYQLERDADVSLRIHDLSGKVVMEQIIGRRAPGAYTITMDTHQLQAGSYYYSLAADDVRLTRRMTVVK